VETVGTKVRTCSFLLCKADRKVPGAEYPKMVNRDQSAVQVIEIDEPVTAPVLVFLTSNSNKLHNEPATETTTTTTSKTTTTTNLLGLTTIMDMETTAF